jgi:rhodanese-related sulfurtransferase
MWNSWEYSLSYLFLKKETEKRLAKSSTISTNDLMKSITPKELIHLIDTTPISLELIDVRGADEFDEVHLLWDITLIPLPVLPLRFHEIDTSKQVILICRSGGRSGQATLFLESKNITAYNLIGGMNDFEKEFPTKVLHGEKKKLLGLF